MNSTKGDSLTINHREPYRATKLWNDAVCSFYNKIPLSRHWRGLRQYENCFTASEAVSWLHNYLVSNPNFEPTVTREHALKLMRKFLKCGLIVEARGNKVYAEDFEDNRELFKFSSQSPLKALRTPGRPPLAPVIANAMSNCGSSPVLKDTKYERSASQNSKPDTCDPLREKYNEEKVKTVSEEQQNGKIQRAWLEAFTERLEMVSEQLIIGGDGSAPLLPMSFINSVWIHHNMTLLKSKGIRRVECLSSDETPSWILSAMKCLANWPNSSDSVCNIPNYPGVEVDIFKVVRDFFLNMVVSLIPYELYDPVIRVYIGAEFLDIAHRTPNCSKGSLKSDCQNSHSQLLSACDSIEDLILNISVTGTQQNFTPCLGDVPCQTDGKLVADSKLNHFLDNCPDDKTEKSNVAVRGVNKGLSPNQTPLSRKIGDGFNSIPRSLKLNRLQNYTDFKDSFLYPGDRRSDESSKSKVVNSVEGNEAFASNRVTLKSLKNRSKLGTRMAEPRIETNSLAGISRDSQLSSPMFKMILKMDELDGFSLPPNSCFETAFTSDSPRTRIIPQKSVDTIHFRDLKSSLRPKSIAVSSLAGGADTNCCSKLGDLEWLPPSLNESFSRAVFRETPECGMNRSLSEGNLLKSARALNSHFTELSSASLEKDKECTDTDCALKKSSSSKGTLAARVRDSVKRKKVKDTLVRFHKSSRNTSYQVSAGSDPNILKNSDNLTSISGSNVYENDHAYSMLKRLRTKSGGYMNQGLNLQSCSLTDSPSLKSSLSDINHFRNASGGFVNIGLLHSKNSLNDLENGEYVRPLKFSPLYPLDSVSCYSDTLSVKSKSQSPSFYSIPPSELSPKSLRKGSCSRSKSATPDGCLSHSMASSLNNSVYHSALSGLNQTALSLAPSLSTKPLFLPQSTSCSRRSLSPPELPKRKPVVMLDSSLEASRMMHGCHIVSGLSSESCQLLSSSASELSDEWVDRIPFGTVPPFVRGGLWRHYHSSPSKRLMGRRSLFQKAYGSGICLPGLLTKLGKEICIEALQLITLILEPTRRKKLYLLLRMMSKVSGNEKLQLDNVLTNRALMVKTFSRAVLLAAKEREYDEMLTTRVVTFLMDNHITIFTPPQQIAAIAHRKINSMAGASKTVPANLPVVFSSSSTHLPLTYCHQVSPQTYQKQRFTGSQQFLSELLDQILENPKLNDKEKRKKLKEFKLHYPEIYHLKFPPGKENEAVLPERKSKLKGLKKFASIKSLTRSKSIRI